MAMMYPNEYMNAAMSREEYEHRKRMEYEMHRMKNMYGQPYAGPGPVDAPAEPKKPKHLNPKLLILKGIK